MTKALELAHVQDRVAGICFAAIGAASIYWSFDYTGASGLYPRMLGIIIVVLGLLMSLRSIRKANKLTTPRVVVDAPRNFFIVLTFIFVYLVLVPLIGFYTSSLLVLLALPVGLGFRRAMPLIFSTKLFIVFLYILFTLVLERPLPREFFQI